MPHDLLKALGWRDRIGRDRFLAHMIFWLALWPAATIGASVFWMKGQTLLAGAPVRLLAPAAAVGALRLAPELVGVAILALAVTFLLFSGLEMIARDRRARRAPVLLILEPLAALTAFGAGVAAVYPSVLRHPFLGPLHSLPVSTVTAIVAAAAVILALVSGWSIRGGKGAAASLVVLVAVAAFGWALATPRESTMRAGGDGVFLLCLDSISQADDLALLEEATRRNGGAWYPRVVSPGLLTNSTWTAVVMNRPVQESGIFLVFQSVPWDRAPFSLVREASRRGFETVSRFTGQFTIYLGSEAGFDRDRSGPKGWLQFVTAAIKDSSLLLPVVLRALPRLPGATTPRNQSGTYGYDLDADLRSVFSERSSDGRPVFVAAHFDYLHAPTYPAWTELSPGQRVRVREAPVDAVTDQSLDWQFPEVPGDPIGLHAWKVRNLERGVAAAIESTGVADPALGNRVIVFSDHGNRAGMTPSNFAQSKYYNVIFATFGIPPRAEQKPWSLLDIAAILGMSSEAEQRPIVAYTNVADAREWSLVEATANVRIDGTVDLDPRLLGVLGARMRCYDPTGREAPYPCPTAPPER